MELKHVRGYAKATKLIAEALSPRAVHLRMLEAYFHGTQYEGMASWFDDSVGIADRAPCVVDTIAKKAAESHSALVLGQGRFPAFEFVRDDDEEPSEADAAEAKALDAFLAAAVKESGLKGIAREVLDGSQGVGSGCAIYGTRKGRLVGNTVESRWCERVDRDDDGNVSLLEILYPYMVAERGADGKWECRVYWYRRIVDSAQDVTFSPARIDKQTVDPAKVSWSEASTIEHGLGFCPVVWYSHLAGHSIANRRDGKAIHALHLDEMTAHDVALSQRHKAAIYAGDPQWTETGVEPGTSPSETVSGAQEGSHEGGRPSAANPINSSYVDMPRNRMGARKKSPGNVWQYESPDVKVQLHTLPAEALKAVAENGHDIRTKLLEAFAYVPLEPEAMKFASSISGKSIAQLREREFDHCDTIRQCFGDGFLLPSVSMLLRIAHTIGKLGAGALKTSGLDAAASALAQFDEADTEGASEWSLPEHELHWGPYTSDDADDDQKRVNTAAVALRDKLIHAETATRKVAPVFGIGDVKKERERIDEQSEKAAAEMQERMHALGNRSQPLGGGEGDENGDGES